MKKTKKKTLDLEAHRTSVMKESIAKFSYQIFFYKHYNTNIVFFDFRELYEIFLYMAYLPPNFYEGHQKFDLTGIQDERKKTCR